MERDSEYEVIIRRLKKLLEGRVTEYEKTLLESIIMQHDRKRYLTERQLNVISTIEATYSEEQILKKAKWVESFDQEKKDIFDIAVKYYASQRHYFMNIIKKVENEENYIPSEATYKQMCENKYVKTVIKETRKKPKFPIPTLVLPSSVCPWAVSREFLGGGIVLRADVEPVTSAANGAKKYLVLPFGKTHGIVCEERWLKYKKT